MTEGDLGLCRRPTTSRSGVACLVVAASLLLGLVSVPSVAAHGGHNGRHCEKGKDDKRPDRGGKGRCKGKKPRPPAGGQVTPPGPAVELPPPSTGGGISPGEVTQRAGDLVVADTGTDANPGTAELPVRTIGRALALSVPGDRILVMPGSYPGFRDIRQRSEDVTIEGVGSPVVQGAELYGASNIVLRGLKFVGKVFIGQHPSRPEQVAHDITVRDSDLTGPVPFSSNCLTIRSGAYEIEVRDNWIHACGSGIAGPGYGFSDPSQIPYSNRITIRGNRLEGFRADAIQFGHWRDVTITDNLISDIHDPNKVEHNDGIQVMGDSDRIAIERNVIKDSGGQLMLVQDALGANDDVLIRDNLSYGAAGYGWQFVGTTNLRVLGNTVWDTRHGGILLRSGTQAWVANNISDFIGTAFGSAGGSLEYFDHNLMSRTWNTVGSRSFVGVDPRFVDPSRGDFRLAGASPAIGAGAAAFSSGSDLVGSPRGNPPTLGALEPAGSGGRRGSHPARGGGA